MFFWLQPNVHCVHVKGGQAVVNHRAAGGNVAPVALGGQGVGQFVDKDDDGICQ